MVELEMTSGTYTKRPFYFFNRHLETIVPSVFYRVPDIGYDRERLELIDGDFLDLDWVRGDNDRLLILSHGMEGSSDRYYMKRAVAYFAKRGWDVLAWNNRGCSGEMNRRPLFAHHGDSKDLGYVIAHALRLPYTSVLLQGFSMGGSQVIKYLMQEGLDSRIRGGVGYSVTCDMQGMMAALNERENWIYRNNFLKKLKNRIIRWSLDHPEISIEGIDKIHSFEDFHRRYTVPLGGFGSLEEFYKAASIKGQLDQIKRPVLMVNALNDPILGAGSYPVNESGSNPLLTFESPVHGGHLGFNFTGKPYSYMEVRTEAFIQEFR